MEDQFEVCRMEKDERAKWEGKVSATLKNTAANQTWDMVKDFFNLHKYFPTLATCHGIHGSNGEAGCIRFCSGFSIPSNGHVSWSKERLVAINHDQRTIVYEIVDSNIGFNSYCSTMKVSPVVVDGHHGSMIEWCFSLEPIHGLLLEDLIVRYEVGLQRMAAKMEEHAHIVNL